MANTNLYFSSAPVARDLYIFLNKQPEEYLKYFYPFEFTLEAIEEELQKDKNIYLTISEDNTIVAFFMLRYTEGYDRATVGYVVDFHRRNKELGKLGIQYLKAYCNLNNLKWCVAHIDENNKASVALARAFNIETI